MQEVWRAASGLGHAHLGVAADQGEILHAERQSDLMKQYMSH